MNKHILMASLLIGVSRDFNKNNRAIVMRRDEQEVCIYSHSVNGGCAIGREVPSETADKMDFISRDTGQGAISNPTILKLLQENRPDMGGLPLEFLSELQMLHDSIGKEYWGEEGLTKLGRAQFHYLWNKYLPYRIS